MYKNFQNNNLFTKKVQTTLKDRAFFKLIKIDNDINRNLFSFWVNDDGQNIHCTTWNNTAKNLNKVFKESNTIEIKYMEKKNKHNNELEYSVREFNIIN